MTWLLSIHELYSSVLVPVSVLLSCCYNYVYLCAYNDFYATDLVRRDSVHIVRQQIPESPLDKIGVFNATQWFCIDTLSCGAFLFSTSKI